MLVSQRVCIAGFSKRKIGPPLLTEGVVNTNCSATYCGCSSSPTSRRHIVTAGSNVQIQFLAAHSTQNKLLPIKEYNHHHRAGVGNCFGSGATVE